MVNKLWCQDVARKWFYRKVEPPHARVFTEPKFQPQVANWYLLYRWMIFAAWAIIILCSVFEFGSYKPEFYYDKWPIYLTNWDLILGSSQALLGGILVSRRWKMQKLTAFDPNNLKLGSAERFYWFLYVVTTDIAIGVTICYWFTVYNPEIHHIDPLNIMLHVCNSILMVIDLCITSIPFRLRNFWWCFSIVIFYLIFSVIYYSAGGLDKYGYHYIYKILDWKKPTRTFLICVGGLAFITVVHCILCLLERFRDHFYDRVAKKLGKVPASVENDRVTAAKQAEIV